jgi:hypothetical protein
VKAQDALSLSHLRNAKDLRITGIKLMDSTFEFLHTSDWLPALLMSTSPTCRAIVESVYLSFELGTLEDMDRLAWGEIDRALSPTRCPRLRNIRLHFNVYYSMLTQAEVAERLPSGLASRGVVEIREILEQKSSL